MNKKQFEKFKRIAIAMVALIFILQRTWVYFEEKNETNEIVFYSLEPKYSASASSDPNQSNTSRSSQSTIDTADADPGVMSRDLSSNEDTTSDEKASEDTATVSSSEITKTSASDPYDGKVNINTASSAELQTLNGIGPALAGRIIEYRNSYGSFVVIEEIMEVKGIGEKTFEKIKNYIKVD